MAIDLINIGSIANDGTGDDLREAFAKVNLNFESLDLRVPLEGIATNLGTSGQGVFARKIGPEYQFKKIDATSSGRIVVTSTDDNVLLDVVGGVLNIETDAGTRTVTDTLATSNISIKGYVNPDDSSKSTQVVMLLNDDTIYIKANTRLKDDLTPKLSGTLDSNNQDIINATNVRATQFFGDLRGTVYGIDVRAIENLTTVFDFGGFIRTYVNPIEYLLDQHDFEFGTFVSPTSLNIEIGAI